MRIYIPLACVFLIPVSFAFAGDQPTPSFADRQKPYFSLLKIDEAWKITRGGPGCTVGVIDMGFDLFHPALQSNFKPGWFAPGVYHTDFLSMDAHGTSVSSIIAAHRKEGEDGMWGVAPDCTILTASMGMPMHTLVRFQMQFFDKNPKASMGDLQKEMEIKQGSCYGPRLSVVAPIENIVLASPHEEAYYSWKDTPMGAPGFDEETGHGRINFLRTLELARQARPR